MNGHPINIYWLRRTFFYSDHGSLCYIAIYANPKLCSSGPIVWLTVSTYCGSSYVTKGHSAIGLYHLMVKTHVRRAAWTVQRSRHKSTPEYREIFFNCYSTHIHGFHCALQCDHRSLIPPLIRTHACSLHSAKAFV